MKPARPAFADDIMASLQEAFRLLANAALGTWLLFVILKGSAELESGTGSKAPARAAECSFKTEWTEPERTLFTTSGGLNSPSGKGARLSASMKKTEKVALELETLLNDANASEF